MMIKAVVFDFDGVVADTGRDIVASVQAAQKKYGVPVLDYDTIMSYVGHGAKYLIDCSMPDLSQQKRTEALAWYKQYYSVHPCDETRLYDGFRLVAESFKQKGIAMSIVSNKPEAITNLIVEQLRISSYFTKVIGPESVVHMKPDPEGLLLCLDAMHTIPAEAVMVGDSYTDIQAGKAAGMHTCAILYGYGDKKKLKAENADFSVSAAFDILREIESL